MDGTIAANTESIGALLIRNPVEGEQRRGSRRFWSTREFKILEKAYPSGGIRECLSQLPGRSASSIYGQATKMKLKRPLTPSGRPRAARKAWPQDENIDAAIRRDYPQAASRRDVLALAERLGRPKGWIKSRATQLGVAQPKLKPAPWTQAELDIILDAPHLNLGTLQKRLARRGFDRTKTAIKIMLIRRDADRTDPDHYTATQLAHLMGVSGKTPAYWIERGLLRATKRHAENGDFLTHRISRKAVREFIVAHTNLVDLCKVDKFWFVELLAGVRIGELLD